jgi:hypothetical protein
MLLQESQEYGLYILQIKLTLCGWKILVALEYYYYYNKTIDTP